LAGLPTEPVTLVLDRGARTLVSAELRADHRQLLSGSVGIAAQDLSPLEVIFYRVSRRAPPGFI